MCAAGSQEAQVSGRDPVNADDTPRTPDDAADRFAAALDGAPQGVADPELARELEIVDLLTRQGSAYDPDPDARVRARRRLLAALAEEAPRAADDGPSRAS
jgi:hypothetical protein